MTARITMELDPSQKCKAVQSNLLKEHISLGNNQFFLMSAVNG